MTQSIFVFGSNLTGRHGKGAALCAMREHGAIYGQGMGRQGNSYAVPTKDKRLATLPIEQIRPYATEFLNYAAAHPELEFQLTRIGCGLAGYTDRQMAPLFYGAPENCLIPPEWLGLH